MKIKFSPSVTLSLDEQEILELFRGNDWYPWVTSVEDDDHTITITMVSPEGEPEHGCDEVSKTFTADEIAKTIEALSAYSVEEPQGHERSNNRAWAKQVIEAIIEDDIDSETQDAFWQYAVYGDLVFG